MRNLLHFLKDGPGGSGGIRCLGDGAADDEVAGSGGERGGGRGDAFLVADGGTSRTDSGDDEGGGGVAPAHGSYFFGARHKAGDAGADCGLGEMQNLIGWSALDADRLELLPVHAGENRNRQKLRRGRDGRGSLDGGFEHSGATGGVDCQELGAEGGDGADGTGDRVRDVVELEVEEDGEAAAAQFGDDGRTLGAEELEANLEPAANPLEAVGEAAGGSGVRVVEGDDQARVDGIRHRFMMARIGIAENERKGNRRTALLGLAWRGTEEINHTKGK